MDQISVVIPNWNGALFLEKAIESALSQGALVSEILVCDDGSTDASAEIVRSFSNPRIQWLAGPHAGLPAVPRNRGIRAAQSPWIAFLDNDDVWLPGKLDRQLSASRNQGVNFSSTNAWRMVDGQRKGPLHPYSESTKLSFKDLARENRVICSSVLARRKDLLDAGLFSEDLKFRAVEDYHLWLRMAERGDISYIAEPLLEYRDQPAQSIRGRDALSVQRVFWVYEDYAKTRFFVPSQWTKAAYVTALLAWRKLKQPNTKSL